MACVVQVNTQRKWDFFCTFLSDDGGEKIPMTRTGAVWMISIWHSSTFSHSWFRFELLVHLDLCCWFNKQTQYIVHHTNGIIKLLTYFQTSSFLFICSSFILLFPLPPIRSKNSICFLSKTRSYLTRSDNT